MKKDSRQPATMIVVSVEAVPKNSADAAEPTRNVARVWRLPQASMSQAATA